MALWPVGLRSRSGLKRWPRLPPSPHPFGSMKDAKSPTLGLRFDRFPKRDDIGNLPKPIGYASGHRGRFRSFGWMRTKL